MEWEMIVMIKVDYQYKGKSFIGWRSGFSLFYDTKKAGRFIRKIISDKNYIYQGFSCDSYDELEEMQYLTYNLFRKGGSSQ